MKYTIGLLLASLAISATATPLANANANAKRSPATPGMMLKRADGGNYTDVDILQYALTLEHLEATFYRQGLANYTESDFAAAGFSNATRKNIELLGAQEATHVSVLSAGLSSAGQKPVEECTYNFGTTDVKSFLGLASVLESVGVSAYLGAAPYISTPAYLTIAAAITTVEARHQAYVSYVEGTAPFPSPFDTAIGLRQVITLAGSFIKSCPQGSAPTLQGFPALALSGNATAGREVTLNAANVTTNGTVYCAFTSGISNVSYVEYKDSKCTVPSTFVGQTYVVLTSSNGTLADNNTIAGPAILALGSGSNYSAIIDSPTATGTAIPSGTSGRGTRPTGTDTSTKSSALKMTIGVAAVLAAIAISI